MALNAAVILVSQSEKILLLKKTYQTFGWTTPGGHIDHEETAYSAAFRELFEETGISLEFFDLKDIRRFIYVDTEIFVLYLNFNEDEFDIVLSKEHSEYAWAFASDLYLYNLEEYSKFSFKQAGVLGLI